MLGHRTATSKRIRIAIVVNSFPKLSETFIFNKVMALRERGHLVDIVAHKPSDDVHLFRDRIGPASPASVRYSLFCGNPLSRMLRLVKYLVQRPQQSLQIGKSLTKKLGWNRRSLISWLLTLPFSHHDIIHFEYTGIADQYLDSLPFLRPARFIVSCRGAPEQIRPLIDPDRAAKLRTVFAELDRVHCVSEDMQAKMERYGLDRRKSFVNHPSIDPSAFCRPRIAATRSGTPHRLVTVARLHWKKGLEYGLVVVRMLLGQGYDVHYAIIGAGPEEEHLRFTIDDLELGAHVTLLGRLSPPEVKSILAQSDVFLLPSLSEGLSNAVLEAMAMELPIVTTTVGGMREAVTDGEEGFLVAPRSPETMAQQVGKLLRDETLRQRMGSAGRGRVLREFTLDRQVDRFVEEYRRVLALDIPSIRRPAESRGE